MRVDAPRRWFALAHKLAEILDSGAAQAGGGPPVTSDRPEPRPTEGDRGATRGRWRSIRLDLDAVAAQPRPGSSGADLANRQRRALLVGASAAPEAVGQSDSGGAAIERGSGVERRGEAARSAREARLTSARWAHALTAAPPTQDPVRKISNRARAGRGARVHDPQLC